MITRPGCIQRYNFLEDKIKRMKLKEFYSKHYTKIILFCTILLFIGVLVMRYYFVE